MDSETRGRLDDVLEDEIHKGYRIKTLPKPLQQQLLDDCALTLSRIRLTRLNPSKRRKIAQVVQQQYHRDLQDTTILSHDQLLKLVQGRGEWTDALEDEMKSLQQSTSREMGDLFVDGLAQDTWSKDLLTAAASFRESVTEKVTNEKKHDAVIERFDRWLEFSPDRQELYDSLYASSQKRDTYSVDFDLQRLVESVPDVLAVEALHNIDDLRDRLNRYVRLQRNRIRLSDLQLKHARIFSDSVEQRRDNAEEMARLYFTSERVDDTGKPLGPLVGAFEGLWDFPEAVVQWLLVEAYFFLNGIPDEAREYLQTFGFIAADAVETISPSGESEPSDESPAPQNSNLGSNLPEEMGLASSDALPDTSLTTGS